MEADFGNKSSLGATIEHQYSQISLPASWRTILIVSSVSYVALCSLLRFRRINNVRSRYNFPDRESLSRMSNQEAHEILKVIVYFEFPTFYDLALRFALFRVSRPPP